MTKLVSIGDVHDDMIKADPLYKRGVVDGKEYAASLLAERDARIKELDSECNQLAARIGKELNVENEALKTENAALRARIADLESAVRHDADCVEAAKARLAIVEAPHWKPIVRQVLKHRADEIRERNAL